ncbi:DUF4893 domain-containing protein [Sphingomonas sp. PvP056]|jgi:hypothetical protein|uniref:DUF4893 domain-containing protein n=1 Tax=Sphingomonas sp. PvP056 TaxID=3156392 RepID=UPI0033959FA4
MRNAMLLLSTMIVLATGCTPVQEEPQISVGAQPDVPTNWHMRVTATDRNAIDRLPMAWSRARAAVPRRARAAVAAEGVLLDPAVALPKAELPPGLYYCRLLRFGGRAGFATFKPDFCTVVVNADGTAFNKQSGTTQPRGWLFTQNDTRQVFLGTFPPERGGAAPAYGVDPLANVAGVVERVSGFRWRMVLSRAGGGALLDVYELVPVTPKVPGAMPAVAG